MAKNRQLESAGKKIKEIGEFIPTTATTEFIAKLVLDS